MTAEVIVMNRLAVALAADSALTISGSKVFNSANKLFMIAPGYPIGILVFNNADFMGVPWEVLIHLYRAYLVESGSRFLKLKEYADDFFGFIENSAQRFISQKVEEDFVSHLLDVLFQHDLVEPITNTIQSIMLQAGSKLAQSQVVDIAERVIDNLCSQWENTVPIAYPADLETRLRAQFYNLFNAKYTQALGNLNLGSSVHNRLWQLVVSWFQKDRWFNQNYSGIAFAGFGDGEIFPSVTVHHIESYVSGHLKVKLTDSHDIGLETTISAIVPLAQVDVVNTFIQGVHPLYQELISKYVPNAPTILQTVNQEMLTKHIVPMLNVVATLPKDELAHMAESLVNMTSFMRRVSGNLETVGGPIDVAVISKKDGFVWINRKHYFSAEQNYQFFNEKRVLHDIALYNSNMEGDHGEQE